jgi:hypothetical protein
MSLFRTQHPLGRVLAALQAAGLGALAALAGSATLAHEQEPASNVCWVWPQPRPADAAPGASVLPEVRDGATVGLRVVVDPSTTNRAALADVDALACHEAAS